MSSDFLKSNNDNWILDFLINQEYAAPLFTHTSV